MTDNKTITAIIEADPVAEWLRRTENSRKRSEFDAVAADMLLALNRKRRTRGASLRELQERIESFVDDCPDPSSVSCVWRDKHDTMREEWKGANGMRSEVDPVEFLEEALRVLNDVNERITVLRKLLKA